MPLFVMYAQDGPDSSAKRDRHRAAHVAHISALDDNGRIVLAGPLKDDPGERSIGALIVFEATDIEAARQLVGQDPYVEGGVFQRIDIQPFKQVFPTQS